MAAVKAIRNVRRLERPRPLNKTSVSSDNESPSLNSEPFFPDSSAAKPKTSTISKAEDVLKDLDFITTAITNGSFNEITNSTIVRLIDPLKELGHQLESHYKDQMDIYFKTLRNASRELQLDLPVRTRLLEIIELRANSWGSADITTHYYHKKLSEPLNSPNMMGLTYLMNSATLPASFVPGQNNFSSSNLLTHSTTQVLTPGEVLKNSGKFTKPTKIPGKNYFKDEVVIRNSDSGKVMGIKGRRVHMIEELSDTVISFQRVSPGTRDRLVQITGPSDECIDRAKMLIEDTIRRNASPIREQTDLSLVTRLGSESSTSLNSTTSEESLANPLLHPGQLSNSSNPAVIRMVSEDGKATLHYSGMAPNNQNVAVKLSKKSLMHSHSMNDASVGEFCQIVSVGHEALRVSGSQADLVQTAKMVLEQYFAGQAKLADMQSIRDLMTCNLNTSTDPYSGLMPTLITPPPPLIPSSSKNLNQQSSRGFPNRVLPAHSIAGGYFGKNNGNFNGSSNSNGRSLTSSSEDDTLKTGENSPEEAITTQNKGLERSSSVKGHALTRVRHSHSFTSSAPESQPELESQSPQSQPPIAPLTMSTTAPRSGSSSSSPVEALSNKTGEDPGTPRIVYTREFLLKCGSNPICKQEPLTAAIVAERAPHIIRRLHEDDAINPDTVAGN